jgi:hypothetical protein
MYDEQRHVLYCGVGEHTTNAYWGLHVNSHNCTHTWPSCTALANSINMLVLVLGWQRNSLAEPLLPGLYQMLAFDVMPSSFHAM